VTCHKHPPVQHSALTSAKISCHGRSLSMRIWKDCIPYNLASSLFSNPSWTCQIHAFTNQQITK